MFLLSDFFVTFTLLLGIRLLLLNLYNAILMSTYIKKKSILIYGIGENSVTLSQGSTRVYMSDYVVRGFIVNSHKKRHFRISGYSVYGVESQEELKELVVRHNIDGILFPNVKLAQKEKDRLIEITVDGKVSGDELADFVAIQEQLEKISVAVETLQLWCERMLATGAIDPEAYQAYRDAMRADQG